MSEQTKIINIHSDEEFAVNRAAQIYFNGGVFIYPTDTLYGLGGDPFNESVNERINKIKNRDEEKRFILLIPGLDGLEEYIEMKSDIHHFFLSQIWPNPVSVVLNLNSKTQKLIGYKTAAFRIPNNRFCTNLLCKIGSPIISSSVNRSNDSPISDFEKIINEFSNDVDAIFYSKDKPNKFASTLIDLTGDKPILIREGTIKFVELLKKFI
ncbi:MAG: L-threonylcarbamoyladenylate synthase [Promethearchaeota archaeon]|jgi:L-threonylcarbamoyladenylate synthase